MADGCKSFVGALLGHRWEAMRQIVPAAIPDTRTYLGQNGWKLETHHFCHRCRTFRDHRHQAAMALPLSGIFAAPSPTETKDE